MKKKLGTIAASQLASAIDYLSSNKDTISRQSLLLINLFTNIYFEINQNIEK
jgi:hypothetical protein